VNVIIRKEYFVAIEAKYLCLVPDGLSDALLGARVLEAAHVA
jgi:hypothetical protein